MFCNQCGEENRNDRKFCSNCGAPLKDYTKPVENPIMPEEIEEKQQSVKKKNDLTKYFNTAFYILLLVGIVFTVLSFLVSNRFKLAATICAFVFVLLSVIVIIVLQIIKSRLNKKIKK